MNKLIIKIIKIGLSNIKKGVHLFDNNIDNLLDSLNTPIKHELPSFKCRYLRFHRKNNTDLIFSKTDTEYKIDNIIVTKKLYDFIRSQNKHQLFFKNLMDNPSLESILNIVEYYEKFTITDDGCIIINRDKDSDHYIDKNGTMSINPIHICRILPDMKLVLHEDWMVYLN